MDHPSKITGHFMGFNTSPSQMSRPDRSFAQLWAIREGQAAKPYPGTVQTLRSWDPTFFCGVWHVVGQTPPPHLVEAASGRRFCRTVACNPHTLINVHGIYI